MKIPILLLTWKRPYQTSLLINALKEVKPKNFYIASDGPNIDNIEEINLVNQTREILESQIDWPCKINKLFRPTNKGCRVGVTNAINWFFGNVKEGIILEDDCIPHPEFFKFAEIMLDRFRDDKRIWTIGGTNFQDDKWIGNGSYYLSMYTHCWGWATWSDRWANYSDEVFIWRKIKENDMLKNIFTSKREENYWNSIFENLYNFKKPDSWAYRWFLVNLANGSLNIIPNKNLVENIGFNSNATHTKLGESPIKLKYKLKESTGLLPIIDPTFFIRSVEADKYTFRTHYCPKFHIKLIKKFKNLF